jgi:hypothetical protein
MTDLQPHRRNPQPAAPLTAGARFTRIGSVTAVLLALSGAALSITFAVESYSYAADASAGASVLGWGLVITGCVAIVAYFTFWAIGWLCAGFTRDA